MLEPVHMPSAETAHIHGLCASLQPPLLLRQRVYLGLSDVGIGVERRALPGGRISLCVSDRNSVSAKASVRSLHDLFRQDAQPPWIDCQ